MVKFRLPHRAIAPAETACYRCANHAQLAEGLPARLRAEIKILVECDTVKFDKKLHHIHLDFGQKPRLIANDSFKPVC
jgi:hypothetical protein